jgi:hypothetical protein
MAHSRQELLYKARTFCGAFANYSSPDVILAMFSPTHPICTVEHGLSRLAPFLGKKFEGKEGIQKYFETIGSLLSYKNMAFSEYVVDSQAMKVSAKGTTTLRGIAPSNHGMKPSHIHRNSIIVSNW